jgi:hypothetical protein
MNVYEEDDSQSEAAQSGLDQFIANGFRMTHMLLKPLRDNGKVKYFRSWFKLKTREDKTVEEWEDKSPRIEIKEYEQDYIRFRPFFSETDYIALINYIGSFG